PGGPRAVGWRAVLERIPQPAPPGAHEGLLQLGHVPAGPSASGAGADPAHSTLTVVLRRLQVARPLRSERPTGADSARVGQSVLAVLGELPAEHPPPVVRHPARRQIDPMRGPSRTDEPLDTPSA